MGFRFLQFSFPSFLGRGKREWVTNCVILSCWLCLNHNNTEQLINFLLAIAIQLIAYPHALSWYWPSYQTVFRLTVGQYVEAVLAQAPSCCKKTCKPCSPRGCSPAPAGSVFFSKIIFSFRTRVQTLTQTNLEVFLFRALCYMANVLCICV